MTSQASTMTPAPNAMWQVFAGYMLIVCTGFAAALDIGPQWLMYIAIVVAAIFFAASFWTRQPSWMGRTLTVSITAAVAVTFLIMSTI